MILDDFMDVTGYDLQAFYESFSDFVSTGAPLIRGYYLGNITEPDAEAFTELDRLLKEAQLIDGVLYDNREGLSYDAEFWELLDEFEDMKNVLSTTVNSGRWMRSVKTNTSYSEFPEIVVVLRQNQTLEALSRAIGNPDGNNEWSQIALRNDLREEDYSSAGGNELRVSTTNGQSIIIDDVVAFMVGEDMYGRDWDRKLTFEDNDLKTLSPQDTINQCYTVLVALSKGDVPEYPNFGTNRVIGGNISSMEYPTYFRQVKQTLLSDSVTEDVSIIELDYEQDILKMKVTIKTKLNSELIKDVFA